jgi:hypothetical protein
MVVYGQRGVLRFQGNYIGSWLGPRVCLDPIKKDGFPLSKIGPRSFVNPSPSLVAVQAKPSEARHCVTEPWEHERRDLYFCCRTSSQDLWHVFQRSRDEISELSILTGFSFHLFSSKVLEEVGVCFLYTSLCSFLLVIGDQEVDWLTVSYICSCLARPRHHFGASISALQTNLVLTVTPITFIQEVPA